MTNVNQQSMYHSSTHKQQQQQQPFLPVALHCTAMAMTIRQKPVASLV